MARLVTIYSMNLAQSLINTDWAAFVHTIQRKDWLFSVLPYTFTVELRWQSLWEVSLANSQHWSEKRPSLLLCESILCKHLCLISLSREDWRRKSLWANASASKRVPWAGPKFDRNQELGSHFIIIKKNSTLNPNCILWVILKFTAFWSVKETCLIYPEL